MNERGIAETEFSPIRWDNGLKLLDQTKLPQEETWIDCSTPEIVGQAIYRLSVRGAPAIGVAAAYGLVVGLRTRGAGQSLEARFDEVAEQLGSTRPTAVNLRWAIERGREAFAETAGQEDEDRIAALLAWAGKLHAADIASNRNIGASGAPLFEPGDRVLTHCNAGALATAGYGTAIGVIHSAFDLGRVGMVWVDETRPLLQGARLTAWELGRLGVPFKVVTDSSVGALMSRGLVDRAVVGADRIAANGDAANKIGTYTAAVMADRHKVPFYVAAPLSTIDLDTPTGDGIPIEERASEEVTSVLGNTITPLDAPAANFAFDVTPHELIAGIITDVGLLEPPYVESIREAFERAAGRTI